MPASGFSHHTLIPMPANTPVSVIDIHFHVGLLGDSQPCRGQFSAHMQQQLAFKIFLLYARMDPKRVNDRTLREATERCLGSFRLVNQVVCLALDPVYEAGSGQRREDLSHMWVDNQYVVDLCNTFSHEKRVLFGASVHPYDPQFESRVKECVAQGAVLLKWLPSAQGIDLADARVGKALKILAKVRGGKPLPLLLHVGPEYAIPPMSRETATYDFLSWSRWDSLGNTLLFGGRRHVPEVKAIARTLRTALDEGATLIFAHCGLPYFASGFLQELLEHSDLGVVREFLHRNPATPRDGYAGCCLVDVSACCTPFRQAYFPDIAALAGDYVLFGSDCPTPVFELSADRKEVLEDMKAVLAGECDRIVVPEDNLIDVNYREMYRSFPGHPMFTNFSKLLS